MEGVPGGTSSESQGPYEGTPLAECRFFSFLVFLILFAFEVTHANRVRATAQMFQMFFFGNWVENLKVTIHQLHRSRWISACNEAASYDQTLSSGCKSVRTILYFLL